MLSFSEPKMLQVFNNYSWKLRWVVGIFTELRTLRLVKNTAILFVRVTFMFKLDKKQKKKRIRWPQRMNNTM